MIKKILKYFGFSILSVIIFFASIAGIAAIMSPDNEEIFEPFISEAIPRITTWDLKEYRLLMSEEGYNSATEDQWKKYLKLFSKLGTYQSFNKPNMESTKTFINTKNGLITYAVYLVPIQFDTGLAHVRLTLQYDDGEVKANGIRYLSDILIE